LLLKQLLRFVELLTAIAITSDLTMTMKPGRTSEQAIDKSKLKPSFIMIMSRSTKRKRTNKVISTHVE